MPRTFDEIMSDAESLPGNCVLIAPDEVDVCVDTFLHGIALFQARDADLLRGRMRAAHFSLCGKQVTVGRRHVPSSR